MAPTDGLEIVPATRGKAIASYSGPSGILLVASSCPMDLNPISGGRPTSFGVEITDG